jgi:hypothetical protein
MNRILSVLASFARRCHPRLLARLTSRTKIMRHCPQDSGTTPSRSSALASRPAHGSTSTIVHGNPSRSPCSCRNSIGFQAQIARQLMSLPQAFCLRVCRPLRVGVSGQRAVAFGPIAQQRAIVVPKERSHRFEAVHCSDTRGALHANRGVGRQARSQSRVMSAA